LPTADGFNETQPLERKPKAFNVSFTVAEFSTSSSWPNLRDGYKSCPLLREARSCFNSHEAGVDSARFKTTIFTYCDKALIIIPFARIEISSVFLISRQCRAQPNVQVEFWQLRIHGKPIDVHLGLSLPLPDPFSFSYHANYKPVSWEASVF
jgi:hypothetical protein